MSKDIYVNLLADMAQFYLDKFLEYEKILIEEYPTHESTTVRLNRADSEYERDCKRIAFLREELKND